MSASLSQISSTDWKMVATSYTKIERNITDCARTLHTIIFTRYPTHPVFFPFVGSDLDTFKRHCTLFLRQVTLLVKNIANYETVKSILRKIAENHLNYKVDETLLEQMRVCFMAMLHTHMTDKIFTPDVFLVWDTISRNAFQYILKYVMIYREAKILKESDSAAKIMETLKLTRAKSANRMTNKVAKSRSKIRKQSP